MQGVGFRPFIYSLAARYSLVGHVANDRRGVIIEVQGARSAIAGFIARLKAKRPRWR